MQGNLERVVRGMTATARIELAREALSLRGAVLPVLAGADIPASTMEVVLSASPQSWRLILTAESCALPLLARLRQSGLLRSLSPAVSGVLAERELAEMQRVMAARAHLRDLDRIATSLGVQATVLKGGAVVAERDRAPLDLGDVDLLVDRDAARRLWQRLVSDGWRQKSASGIAATDAADAAFNHFDPLIPPSEGLAVELHARAWYGSGPSEERVMATRPLTSFRALHRTVGPEAFVSMLEHSVTTHPHRRGHLRDLCLLADAARECEPGDRIVIARRLDGSEYEPELRDMLAQVEALVDGAAPSDPPSIRRAVARKYLLVLGDDGRLATHIPRWWTLSYFPLERRPVRRARYAELARSAFAPAPAGSPFAVGDGLARIGARLVRAAYRCALVLATVGSGRRIRKRSDSVAG